MKGEDELSQEDWELLAKIVMQREPRLSNVLNDARMGRRLTADEANAIRDALGSELMETGVDRKEGAINEWGKRIDDLIDRVAEISELNG